MNIIFTYIMVTFNFLPIIIQIINPAIMYLSMYFLIFSIQIYKLHTYTFDFQEPIKYFCFPKLFTYKLHKYISGVIITNILYITFISKINLLNYTAIKLQVLTLPVILVIIKLAKNQEHCAGCCLFYGIYINIVTCLYKQNINYIIFVNCLALVLIITLVINRFYNYHGYLFSFKIISHLVAIIEIFLFMITIVDFNTAIFNFI